MTPRFVLQLLVGAGIAISAQPVLCAELTPYWRTTPQGQPKSDLGFNFAAQALDLRGAITTRLAGNTTLITPQLVSSYALAPDLKFETRATFTNWNERTGSLRDAVETRLTARSPLPMLAEVEGLVARNGTGESHRKLRFRMNDATLPSFLSEPIQLKTNATIETVGMGTSPSTLKTGVEATLVQKTSPTSPANKIGLRYNTETRTNTLLQRQAATFSRSWIQNDILRLGVEYEVVRDTTNLQSAVRFTWQGLF